MNVQRGDPKLRVIALGILTAVLIAGLVLLAAMQHWFTHLEQIPAAAAQAQLLGAFAWAVGIVCSAVLWLAVSLWRLGAHVRRSAQWPLPGARVLRDTRVLQGNAAIGRGRFMQAVGAILFVCAMCVAVIAWRLHHAFAAAAV